MKRRPLAVSGTPSPEANGYDAPSMQTISIDGYTPEPVIASWQQVGKYKLPLASVSNQNDGGILLHDGVENLYSGMNTYMPQWGAPSNGRSYNQTGGMISIPMSSYTAGQYEANPITVNADQASAANAFIMSQSPRYVGSMSSSGGE
jgi:hypothetical protein